MKKELQLLFKFKKNKLFILEFSNNEENISIINKSEKEFLGNNQSEIFFEIEKFINKYIINKNIIKVFIHKPSKFRGVIKDIEGYSNLLFSGYILMKNKLNLIEISSEIIKANFSLKNKDFKIRFNEIKSEINNNLGIKKSDEIMDSLAYIRFRI